LKNSMKWRKILSEALSHLPGSAASRKIIHIQRR
jgi:hypothetical protein